MMLFFLRQISFLRRIGFLINRCYQNPEIEASWPSSPLGEKNNFIFIPSRASSQGTACPFDSMISTLDQDCFEHLLSFLTHAETRECLCVSSDFGDRVRGKDARNPRLLISFRPYTAFDSRASACDESLLTHIHDVASLANLRHLELNHLKWSGTFDVSTSGSRTPSARMSSKNSFSKSCACFKKMVGSVTEAPCSIQCT